MSGQDAQWSLPAWWWGPLRSDRTRHSLSDLVELGLCAPEDARQLTQFIAAGASTIVCALPGGAGKSTLLAALLPALASERQPLLIRGMFDPLTELAEADPSRTAVLINELSPHLPIYCWGQTARRVFDAGLVGAQLLATAHADDPEGLVHQLMAYPTSATPEHLRLWDLVLFLDVRVDGTDIRRELVSVVSLSGAAERGIAVTPLARRHGQVLVWNQNAVRELEERLRQR